MNRFTSQFGTDNGPACTCGGTVYGYRIQGTFPNADTVESCCIACGARDYFRIPALVNVAAHELREYHAGHVRPH